MAEMAYSKINTVLTVDFTFHQRKIKTQPGGGGGESKSIAEKRGHFLGHWFFFFNTCSMNQQDNHSNLGDLFLKRFNRILTEM